MEKISDEIKEKIRNRKKQILATVGKRIGFFFIKEKINKQTGKTK